ncbi:hypothetical protein EA473_14040 [Natrarchaeobius chitinivorans]|uniref:Uncharacterized protein n=1 Tax=Natrarchaeobius chitinivorans TaxID=1679083 RepID=A0A3N6ME22_NATCH|nr:hypothetical protein EA473_14040 [Natrarchaeobius chitinivorans]
MVLLSGKICIDEFSGCSARCFALLKFTREVRDLGKNVVTTCIQNYEIIPVHVKNSRPIWIVFT